MNYLTIDTLPLANDFFFQTHSGLATPSYFPFAAHSIKKTGLLQTGPINL
jgi:hypothetical protein